MSMRVYLDFNATAPLRPDQIDLHDFDVLVVDVQLKQGSGIGTVRDARARWSVLAPALIIVLTNHSYPTVRQHCLAAGADHFLDKSQQFDQVVPLIMGFSGRALAAQ